MHCLTCGYDLRGLSEPRCPECGRAFDPDNIMTFDCGRRREVLQVRSWSESAFQKGLIVVLVSAGCFILFSVDAFETAWSCVIWAFLCGMFVRFVGARVSDMAVASALLAWMWTAVLSPNVPPSGQVEVLAAAAFLVGVLFAGFGLGTIIRNYARPR